MSLHIRDATEEDRAAIREVEEAAFGQALVKKSKSDFQCDALQARTWGEAPTTGRLVYAAAFSAL